jgi:hypothetical protein
MKTYRRVEAWRHPSYPRRWMKVSDQAHAPAVLFTGKQPLLPIVWKAEWAPEPH